MAALLAGCGVRPAFVSKPSGVYRGFNALEMPRVDYPVGALWVEGFGPTGPGAATDNLISERSLSGITFDTDLQANLTAGLLKFLQLDPSYRNKITARFADVTIVRVKDMTKLVGPAGQLRVYGALKAGTINITTSQDVGLAIENRAIGQNLPLIGRGSTGSVRTFSLDGKDLYFAFTIARLKVIWTKPIEVKLTGQGTVSFHVTSVRFEATRSAQANAEKGDCTNDSVVVRLMGYDEQPAPVRVTTSQKISLPVPVSDEAGGLYSVAEFRLVHDGAPTSCKLGIRAQLVGDALIFRK